MVLETAEELSWWEAQGPTKATGSDGWTNMGRSDSATLARARGAAEPGFRKLDGTSKSNPLWRDVYLDCKKRSPGFMDNYVKDLTWPQLRTKLSERWVQGSRRSPRLLVYES